MGGLVPVPLLPQVTAVHRTPRISDNRIEVPQMLMMLDVGHEARTVLQAFAVERAFISAQTNGEKERENKRACAHETYKEREGREGGGGTDDRVIFYPTVVLACCGHK